VNNETTIPERPDTTGTIQTPRTALVLVVAWCGEEPWRVGEVLLGPPGPPGPTVWFGRGPSVPGEPLKAPLGQLRPGQWLPSAPLGVPAISRYQLSLTAVGGGRLHVRNEGRCSLMVNDTVVDGAEVGAGDLVQLGKQLLFVCAPRTLGQAPMVADFPFGGPDRNGFVGESHAAWELRRQIAAVARREGHVLVSGQSGTGKELVAQAIHALSARGGRQMVARNAATIPDTLIDAELFGNARNYPNPGMADRPGLIGEAHQSTLFLDEFAELPPDAQAHLLRVLDAGEYHRLGETQARVSDFRLIAATNRELSAFKHDILARLVFHLTVPALDARLDDVPLLVRHLLATGDLKEGNNGRAAAPVSLKAMRQLLRHPYTTGLRELRFLLSRWTAGLAATTTPVTAAPEPRAPSPITASSLPAQTPPGPLHGVPTGEEVQRCLDENNGILEQTWRALGLKNRFALLRLIKRYDVEVRRRPGRR
jgi:two-component system nitrogen regulation response regulator GlnG/two-component system response regulator HydG